MRNFLFALGATVTLVSSLFTFSTTALSQSIQSEENLRLGSASFISEMIECAVFYSIIANAQDNKGNALELSEEFFELSESLYMFAFNLAEEIGMKSDTLIAKAEESGKKMGEAIDFDAINISILTNKYGDLCKMIVANPEERFAYWLLRQTE